MSARTGQGAPLAVFVAGAPATADFFAAAILSASPFSKPDIAIVSACHFGGT
jgi:hypothetical protein